MKSVQLIALGRIGKNGLVAQNLVEEVGGQEVEVLSLKQEMELLVLEVVMRLSGVMYKIVQLIVYGLLGDPGVIVQ